MSASQFQAMMSAGGVSGSGERELKKHLGTHLGKGFCPTRRSVHMLAKGHTEVNYGSIEFTYDGKEKAEFIKWTEKNIHKEIAVYLQRHLMSKSINPSEIVRIQVIVSGDHRDTALQLGASVSVELSDGRVIDFEVSVCELICHKDTGKLIESTILMQLTQGLIIVATWDLNIEKNNEGGVKYWFSKDTKTTHSHIVNVYVTSNLAFQAMALGKESMSGWCGACCARHPELNSWTIIARCG
jgi:hypothetical protein